MKKSFSVFTLVMLLAVQILTPVTYAVGDEEFVEESIVQEEPSEDVDEVSDDADDETEDVDLDEEEDEDSLSEEEDSFSGDVVYEDSLEMSGDVVSDAETESGDVVVIDNESWAVAATGSEVVVESGVDVSGTSSSAGSSESSVTVDDEFITKLSKQGSVAKIAEKLGINWYTDSSEWAIKAGIEGKYLGTKEQNNIIREYFIQHAREILGAQESNEVVNEEVVEEPEVVVELNKEEISGRKYYNGVTAIVLAPINTFPEGTTLSIVPIKAKKDLNEIKEQLVEQQDEVTEESNVVAFDISFIYSGEEVQPVSGQTVQVTFNYGNHEKLSEANEDEEKELKVYHLNDKDGSGNKVEDIKDVKVEAVDIVKNEEGELVVDAESFSIYTIVTQVAEEGPEALEDQLANFVYGEISIVRPDSITASGYPDGFTIMDRNLGALKTGAYTDALPTSYGYHYQWGNNYGFNPSWTEESNPNNFTGNQILIAEGTTGYSGNKFVWGTYNYTWMEPSNINLWGGNSNSVIDKQGPCPEGWHVPTAREWSQLMEYYVSGYFNIHYSPVTLDGTDYKLYSNQDFASGFANYFNLPLAGYRSYFTPQVNGSYGIYWSSSPKSSTSYSTYSLYLGSSSVVANYSSYRAYGYSVRCFKNTYTPESDQITMSFDFKGGRGSTAAIKVQSNTTGVIPSEPQRANSAFTGWYVSGTDTKYDFTENITAPVELYAKYDCDEGFEPNEDGTACVQYNTVTFNVAANGGTTGTAESVKVISGEILDLDDYTGTKAGWDFVGWNTVSTETGAMENPEVTGDMNLYAIFSKTVTITFNTTGSSNWTSVERECTMYNNDPNCSITSPDINVVGWTAFGWSTSQNDHNNEWSRNTQKDVTASGTYYAQFFKPAETFTGNFNKNGVDSVTYTSTGCSISEVWNNGVRDETCIVKAPNIVRNGWNVVGFNTDSTAHESSLNMGDNLTLSSSNNGITYHAITKKPITISFNANGNGGSYTPIECSIWNTLTDCSVESPAINHPTGFEPIGWSTSSDSHVNEWSEGESQSFSENTTYYAQTQKYITAIFSGNGNKLQGNKDQIVKTGYAYNNGTLLIDVPAIQDNEYTDVILGYSLNAVSGSPIATIGGVTLNSGTIENGTAKIQRSDDVTLYAQTYKPAVTRTVTYQKGAGNDAKGVISFSPYNDSCTIAAIYNGNNGVPQATGCELVAPEILVANNYAGYWEGPLYSGDIYTVYENKTLNAYSTGEHYSISFYLDGGTWPTNVTQQDSYQQGDTVVINAPIWTGYTFIGWTTGSNTEPVMNVSIQPTDKGAKLFVAHWQQDEYRIIYSDTVQGTTNLVKTYSYNNGSTLVAPNKSPIGYTFKGWIGENGDTPETSVTIPSGVVGDKYFTAVWEPRTYTVTGHLNGGKIGEETSYVFTYDIESENINLSTPTRDNSTFVGWTGSNGSSPDLNVVISQGSHGDKEYYAVYSCNEGYEANGNTCVLKPYSVTYVLDEGKHTTVNPQETVTRDETSYKINIKNPIKTGYNFQGWMTNIGNLTCKEGVIVRDNCRAESENDLTIEFTEGQAVTLTAKWTHVPIEVTQQDLIGTTPTGIAVVTQYDYENGRVDLAAEIMTGYKTKGWSLDTNGVVVYNDQTKEYVKGLNISYDNPTAVTGGTGRVSLYSVRELINYNIKYLTDEGVHINPLTYNVTQQDIALSDAEKTGYVFNGWYDTDENKIETITPETIAEITSPYKLTLTAKWQASKNTKYHVYHERAWIDGNYYKLSGDLTDIDELTGETNTSVIAQRKTNYVGFIMPVDQKTAKIEADGSTEIIYQYEREKNTYKYNETVGATTAWKRSIDTNYSTNSSMQQMYYETPIILSGRANTGYAWSGWDVTIGTETTRIEGTNDNHEHTIIMPLTNVEVTPVVYHIPYTLTYNVNGGTGNETELQEVSPIYYDSGITYPVVTRTGYSFQGWYDDNGTEDESDDVYYGSGDGINNKNMSNKNLNLVAHWSANPFVLKVNHYQMDLTGNYPTQPTKEVSIDTTIDADITSGNNANILPETYTGFTLSGDVVESIHINPDGTTKIDYYYIRDKHNITVNTNEGVTLSGTLSGSYYYQTPVSVEAIINEGYTWSGWNVTTGENEPVFTTDTGVSLILGTGNVILTPLTTTNSYHLTIKNDGILVFSGDVLYKTNISQYLTTPSKAGYTFNGWSNRPVNDLMPAKDLVIEAKWTYKSNGGGGGGGGGSSSSDDKKVIINNTGDKQQEHSSTDLTGTNLTGTNKDLKENEVKEEQSEKAITDMNFDELKNLSADKLKKVDRTKLTKEENEILDAYEWAYEHNVTTMVTLNDANPEGIVTRGHLAKMVVNYAINVLGQQLPEKVPSECRWNDWRGDWESDEIKDYAVKACSLGLMGLDMKKFSPKLRVTRAQFGTIMSRLLWGKKYAGGTPYYRKHLNALKENNIMTQIGNPEGRVELRQWVWLMLMRAAMDKNV